MNVRERSLAHMGIRTYQREYNLGNYAVIVPVADHLTAIIEWADALSGTPPDFQERDWYLDALAEWLHAIGRLSGTERLLVAEVMRDLDIPLPGATPASYI